MHVICIIIIAADLCVQLDGLAIYRG